MSTARSLPTWLSVVLLASSPLLQAAGTARLVPCRIARVEETVRCASVEVPEDRAVPQGRRIVLRVVVLPALGTSRAPDPVFHLEGGPGIAATESAPLAAREHRETRRRRDVVLVDQRGTGGSNPLPCLPFDTDIQRYLGQPPEEESIRACRDSLEARADLRLYGTTHAVADLEDVRRALGYARIDLDAISYGSRVALAYMSRHPARVRSAVLRSATPPGYRIPLPAAGAAETSLRGLLRDCTRDPRCRTAFPDVDREVRAVLERLELEPARVEVVNPATGRKEPATLTQSLFASRLQLLLLSPHSNRLPLVIHRAHSGDHEPFADLAADFGKEVLDRSYLGASLSVLCTEDLPFISPDEAGRESAGTFLGTLHVDQLVGLCRSWPRGRSPEDIETEVLSDVPTLLVSAAMDPWTPSRFAAEAARRLPRSRHVIVPSGANVYGGACLNGIVTRFFAQGSAAGIDAACLASIERVRFLVSDPPKPRPRGRR